MKVINIHEAKTHLSRLLEDVREGKELIIAKSGKPIAKLVPLPIGKSMRTPGYLKNRIKIADNFDAPLPAEWLHDLEGRE